MKGGNSKTDINTYLNKIPKINKIVFLTPCTSEEIRSLIDKLPNKHSSGYDNIDNILLKKLSSVLIDPYVLSSTNPYLKVFFQMT